MRGQVCYEADVNQYKRDLDNLEDGQDLGFSFIIDTNDEYDGTNLLEEKTPQNDDRRTSGSSVFLKTLDNNKFRIRLKTISIEYDITSISREL